MTDEGEKMDLTWRYVVLVQVIVRDGRDLFYGLAPGSKIEIYEVVDSGNISHEYMFHLIMMLMIGEALSVYRAEEKELPLIRSASHLIDGDSPHPDAPTEKVSTKVAASMLRIHSDTVRALFDRGVLKGSITQGGQRMILASSIDEE